MTNQCYLSVPSRMGQGAAVAALALASMLAAAPASAQALRLPSAPPAATPAPPAVPALRQAPRPVDSIVAVVNSEPITRIEVQNRLARVEEQLARQGAEPPRGQLSRDVLERLILERAQLQLARQLGVRPEEAAVTEAMASVARQNQLTVEQLKRRLEADGISFERFRSDLRDELTLVRLREREVDSRVKVSDQEIEQFLRERQASAEAGPAQIRLAQILVAVPENATPAQVSALQAKAERAVARLRAGEAFAAVAADLSDAPDRAAGGDLGLRLADRLPTLFVEATQSLPVGGLAGPLRSGAGFHVLQLKEKKRGLAPLTIPQTRVRHILLRPGQDLSEQAARDRLADFRRRIGVGQADFAALARDHSQDGSAAEGGDLGWAAPGMFVPEFEQVMNALAPGQLSEPLVSRFGVHLIQVLARRDAPLSEREQREVIRNQVREKKIDEAYSQWLQDVRGRAYVELRE